MIHLLKKQIQKKGFTLIETLVAISILLLSIVGPLEIASKGLFSAFYARDEISAYYLAQEGIEFVRNLRDTNYLNMLDAPGTLWLDNLDPSCFEEHGCTVNPRNVINSGEFIDSFAECLTTCPKLKYDADTSIFLHGGSSDPDSKFTRNVKVIYDGVDPESSTSALIETTVSWQTGTLFSSTKSFVLRERIFNWNQ